MQTSLCAFALSVATSNSWFRYSGLLVWPIGSMSSLCVRMIGGHCADNASSRDRHFYEMSLHLKPSIEMTIPRRIVNWKYLVLWLAMNDNETAEQLLLYSALVLS
jgi:hypothetical protein